MHYRKLPLRGSGLCKDSRYLQRTECSIQCSVAFTTFWYNIYRTMLCTAGSRLIVRGWALIHALTLAQGFRRSLFSPHQRDRRNQTAEPLPREDVSNSLKPDDAPSAWIGCAAMRHVGFKGIPALRIPVSVLPKPIRSASFGFLGVHVLFHPPPVPWYGRHRQREPTIARLFTL